MNNDNQPEWYVYSGRRPGGETIVSPIPSPLPLPPPHLGATSATGSAASSAVLPFGHVQRIFAW